MAKRDDFKKVTVSFVIRAKEEREIINELQNLPYGIYHMGTETLGLTNDEWAEVTSQTPEDIL